MNNIIARKLREAVERSGVGIIVKRDNPVLDYDIAWLVDDAADEIVQLQQWKDDVEDFLGQRGIENLRAMLDIIDAARKWERWMVDGAVYSRELDARKELHSAVQAYEDMVKGREEKK